jgi:hypothetical protein
MTATPQGTPQLTIPEGQEGIASPDQQELVEQIQQESQVDEDAQKVLEKFNGDKAAIAKSYAELQRKFTQNQQQKPETQPETKTEQTEPQVESYTAEQAAQVYGKETVDALAEKGMDLGEVMFKADSGEDISQHYDTLAEAFNVPRQVVENYVSGAKAPQSTEPQGLSEQQEQAIKDEIGGDDAYAKLDQWAGKNLSKEMVESFNQTMESGNIDAIKWAIRNVQMQMESPNAVVEPKLIGGGDVPSETTFQSKQQVLDAMSKTNDRGQKIYETDPAYQESVKQMLARSPAWDSLK